MKRKIEKDRATSLTYLFILHGIETNRWLYIFRMWVFIFVTLFILSGVAHSWDQLGSSGEDVGEAVEYGISGTGEDLFLLMDRSINVMYPRTVSKRTFLIVIDHRNWQAIGDDTFNDFFGFDAGNLKAGVGFRYGIFKDFDIGIYRINGTVEEFDVYELDLRYRFLREDDHWVNMSFRSGGTWFSWSDEDDEAGVFEQILISKSFYGKVKISSGALYHSQSTNDEKQVDDDDYSIAIPAIMNIQIFPMLSWSLEAVTNVDGYSSSHPAISSGFKVILGGHTFSIIFSNTQYITADGIVTNSSRGFRDTILGFSITREFKF